MLRERWLRVKLATTLVLTALIGAVLLPRLANDAAADTGSRAFTVGQRLPLALVPAAATVVLAGLVTLAVTKPRLRFRHDPRTLDPTTPWADRTSA